MGLAPRIEIELADLKNYLAAAVDADLLANTTFVVPHTWPDIKNAEYEVLQRVSLAARNIGATMIVVDNDGYPLWSNGSLPLDSSRPIDPTKIDFMISFHFESPRLIDTFSYYAVWQPLDFYFHFGYSKSVEKLLTHNECLSCRAALADAHASNLFKSIRPYHAGSYPPFFHSSPEPYLAPRIAGDARLFYVGINWERLGGKKGRHHDLLLRLDEAKLIDIYGPKELLGGSPWEGFESYRGELPFDGISVIRAINASGICLALSSAAHNKTGLMSNRLFEGLAAGAAIIADSNAFVEKYFSDVVYHVDDAGDDLALFSQISAIVDRIRRDPLEASERARKGQRRLKESFSLEGCLRALIAGHQDRLVSYRASAYSAASITVLAIYLDEDLGALLAMIDTVTRQTAVAAHLVLICDAGIFQQHEALILEAGRSLPRFTSITRGFLRRDGGGETVERNTVATGEAVAEALAALETDYFCFLRNDEDWFHDHLATVTGAIERAAGAVMGVSGALIEEQSATQRRSRQLHGLRFHFDQVRLLNGQYAEDPGRFVFSRRVLADVPMSCLPLLDGQEPNLVKLAAALSGEPAQSGYATYVRKVAENATLPASIILEEEQQQYIRDAFAANRRWLERVTRHSAMPAHLYAYSRGAPVRSPNLDQPVGVARKLPVDRLVDTRANGSGLIYLQHGFSDPGPRYTWIEDEYAVIEFLLPRRADAQVDWNLVLVMGRKASVDSARPLHCTVAVNGNRLAYLEIPAAKTRFCIRLPSADVQHPTRRMRIHIIPDSTAANSESDDRKQPPPIIWLRRFGMMSADRRYRRKGWWWRLAHRTSKRKARA